LNDLIEDLLPLTRLESGEVLITQGSIDLEHLVRDIVADAAFEAHAGNKQVHLTHSEPCRIQGIASLLRSAIENAVRNAVRHTRGGTAVEVSLSVEVRELSATSTPKSTPDAAGVWAFITVRDHGSGVLEANLSDLLRPFYRVESARDRESGGVGLGLAITGRAVHSHGGTVSVANTIAGGLQIEICLPLHQSE
jgi:two-component system sensor histidine kinase CpxA